MSTLFKPPVSQAIMIGNRKYTHDFMDVWLWRSDDGTMCHGYYWMELVKIARANDQPIVALDTGKATLANPL